MTCLPHEGLYFDKEWIETPEFEQTINFIYPKNMRNRKVYGLLDIPLVPTIASELYCYKLFIVGKSNVGKTSLLQQICHGTRSQTTHSSSVAVITDHVFWPCRLLSGELILIKLEIWDADDYAIKRYQHSLPTLQHKADGTIFVFSATDHQSLDDIPNLMSRTLEAPSCSDLCRFVVGAKFDDVCHTEVPLRELDSFRRHWGLPIFRTHSYTEPCENPHVPLLEMASLLNYICESLWHRDKILAGARQS